MLIQAIQNAQAWQRNYYQWCNANECGCLYGWSVQSIIAFLFGVVEPLLAVIEFKRQ